MRNILCLLCSLSLFSSPVLAQDDKETTNSSPAVVKHSSDFLILQLGYNNWSGKPDSVKTSSFGYVFNAFLCYDFPIKKSSFSFATGIGINANVVYLDGQTMHFSDTGVLGHSARVLADTMNYSSYKFATTYLQAPFELRYFANKLNRNRGFKAALGLEVGLLLGAHTKGIRTIDGSSVTDKVNTKRYLSTWNFVATARAGWGNFAIFGSYNLSTVFQENQGPVATPYSIGVCVTGL